MSKELLVTSKTRFYTNLSFNIIIFWAFLSNIFTIANPLISFTRDTSIFVNHCSFGFNIICSLGNNVIDLFRKLTHDSHEFIILLAQIYIYKFTFSCISDSNVKISNL